MIKKISYDPELPCICGSGKSVLDCHMDWDGKLRKPLPDLRPPGVATGYSHPKCYLHLCNDCSTDISREHYMSEAVLSQLGKMLSVTGMPWLNAGEVKEISVANLTARILCKRHNEALSPLDQEAALFFGDLRNVILDLDRKTLSRKPHFHLVSGQTLELWMLKVACGVYFSVGAGGGQLLSKTHTIDMYKVTRALFDGQWDNRAGLYFLGNRGSVLSFSDHVQFSLLSNDKDLVFGGVRISLLGLTLEFLFDTSNANPGPWQGLIRRPTELTFTHGQRSHYFILTWPPGTPEQSVNMQHGRPPPGFR